MIFIRFIRYSKFDPVYSLSPAILHGSEKIHRVKFDPVYYLSPAI